MIWISDHLGLVLVVGLSLGIAAFLLGGLGVWRTARRLRTPRRSIARLAGSIALAAAGAFGILFFGSGAVQMGPGLEAQRAMIDRPIPEVRFGLVESDREATLADYRDSVVLVNVWATWCPPCIHEMPALDRLQRDYRDRGLVVLHLSDEERETVAAWLEERTFETVHGYVASLPWPEMGRPATFVVDRDGVVRRILLGARTYEQFEAEVERWL